MNDKCAAGTGRFLEVMSRVLEISLDKMGEEHFKAQNPAKVSSTCTVFAESEVISLLSQGIARENILYGVHESVASKACALANRAGVRDDVVMCGGVAQNAGVVVVIGKMLERTITVAPNPQLSGALALPCSAPMNWKRTHIKNIRRIRTPARTSTPAWAGVLRPESVRRPQDRGADET